VTPPGNDPDLHSLQPDRTVEVAIRIRDTPRPPPEHAEGTVPVTLESPTGILVAPVPGPYASVTLPRPGLYQGHASWTGRRATADYYDQRIQRGAAQQWDADRIGQAWQRCSTQERYALHLW
jgi:hypothetical protein